MTIDELITKKKQMEKHFLESIKDFENNTGTIISRVSLFRNEIYQFGDAKKPAVNILYDVDIEVKIN